MSDQQMHLSQNNNSFVSCVFEKKWHPVPTITSTYIIYASFGIVFVIISILMYIENNTILQYVTLGYDQLSDCQNVLNTNKPCNVTIKVEQYMKSPIYFMYQLQNFYQNHRRYLQSKDNSQLAGFSITLLQAMNNCNPISLNSDLNTNLSWAGYPLKPNEVASPCGLIAKSFFNDTFKMYGPSGNQIQLNQNGIAWPGDKGKKYKRSNNSQQTQWIDPQNQHFIIWMRTSSLPHFKKLWAIINEDLDVGNYTIQITNNYNVQVFHAKKNLHLTTIGLFGGSNMYLALGFLLAGIICFIIIGIFFYRSRSTNGKFGALTSN